MSKPSDFSICSILSSITCTHGFRHFFSLGIAGPGIQRIHKSIGFFGKYLLIFIWLSVNLSGRYEQIALAAAPFSSFQSVIGSYGVCRNCSDGIIFHNLRTCRTGSMDYKIERNITIYRLDDTLNYNIHLFSKFRRNSVFTSDQNVDIHIK